MDREAVPHFGADLIAEQAGQRFTTVNVEIVDNQMDGSGGWILERKLDSNFGELGRRTIRRGEGEVTSRLGFYRAEEVSRAAALVLVVLPGLSSGFGQRGGTHIAVFHPPG